eukprot:jgi/Botrbrau1/19506/Bobra.0035s0007.1
MNPIRTESVVVEEPYQSTVGDHCITGCLAIHASSRSATISLGEVSGEDVPNCWICLDENRTGAPLLKPCACPRHAHDKCLARWQLQSAGSRKETHCEFCDKELPDWKQVLTPKCGADAPAVMNVNFDGKVFGFEVKPGLDGYREFTNAIRRAFSLAADSELNITFTCDEPSAGWQAASNTSPLPSFTGTSLLTLQGPGAYDAAVHCASVSAARRNMQSRSTTQQGCPSSPMGIDHSSSSTSSSSSATGAPAPDLDYLTRHVLTSAPRTPSSATSASRFDGAFSPKSTLLRKITAATKRLGSSLSERVNTMWRNLPDRKLRL